MKRTPLTATLALLVFALSVAAVPSYRLSANLDTLQMIDCEYAQESDSDLGRKNTIASNIPWAKYAPEGEDSLLCAMVLKFRDSFPADEAALILPVVSGDTVRSGRFLSNNDTARVYMLFFPSSAGENVDTLSLEHHSYGTFRLPGINYRPHGVYSVEIRRVPLDTIPQ